MSMIAYISFPNELKELYTLYIKDRTENEFRVNPNIGDDLERHTFIANASFFECEVSLGDISGATFNKCFSNQFIYELSVFVPEYYDVQKSMIVKKYMEEKDKSGHYDDNAMKRELNVYWNKHYALQNQAMHKFLYTNLNVGEFAEIYVSWIEDEDYHFESPTLEVRISLDDLLNNTGSIFIYPLKFGEREKLTIYKTGDGSDS